MDLIKTSRLLSVLLLSSVYLCVSAQTTQRKVISFNGVWQIAEGDSVHIPEKFEHNIQVPGLITLADPAFEDVGPKVKDRGSLKQSDPLRESFWYHRTFTINSPIPEVAILKIAKAKYGTKVFLNGREIGINWACFTPGYFNVKGALKRGENELIVRVGASRDALPPSIPDGFDFEKERYIPGIYDNVTLTLSGAPHIVRVQTVPDIIHKELQVQLTLDSTRKENSDISFIVQEAKSLKVVGSLDSSFKLSGNEGNNVINVRLPLKDCHLWSPEDPFLYHLLVKTEGDTKEVEFGMREFHFSNLTKNAVLNGKPYFLRGSNITIYRFFEDSVRKNLPWDTIWVRNLFKSLKQFHWNSLRFCIGFPPDFWYKIADEEGILIQNEFPVWYGGGTWSKWPKELKADELAKEYTAMIYEYWNHPSVVIWDASNETYSPNRVNDSSDETAKAVWHVRNIDLSNRPWDNSYSKYRAPGDVYESHPYHFQDPNFKLQYLAKANPIPDGNEFKNLQNFPVIINEYGWLWLNRDGTPTTLTKQLYENLLGPNSTTEQRWHLYTTYMAAETEFWRCHRKAAGVLIFTALGYSRPDGQTSDFFTDVTKLKYDNDILKYLPDAFSPIGIMLDEWGNKIDCNKPHSFKILAINDLGKEWKGTISLRILKNDKQVLQKSTPLVISAYGQKSATIICHTPDVPGTYTVEAVLDNVNGRPVKSIREIPFSKE
jgi:hypothetical protein